MRAAPCSRPQSLVAKFQKLPARNEFIERYDYRGRRIASSVERFFYRIETAPAAVIVTEGIVRAIVVVVGRNGIAGVQRPALAVVSQNEAVAFEIDIEGHAGALAMHLALKAPEAGFRVTRILRVNGEDGGFEFSAKPL